MIVAFDPGRNIGVAFVSGSGRLQRHLIVDAAALRSLDLQPGATILVGDGTGSREVVSALVALGLEPELVGETATTLEARSLYFRDNPPRGWQRLLPVGMRSPPVPIDDYAAFAIALRWLDGKGTPRVTTPGPG
ncbi:MAG TPA: hypothetical protein VFN03_02335 [Trueperaceae bacterium]|nr:hypothetical protein [Trueperaceae bacterium]